MNAKLLAKEPRTFAAAKGRCFIDTNVLVYAHANDEVLKQSRALALVGQLHFLRQLEVVLITPDMLNQALALHQTHQMSFDDALIVIAAQASHCSTIYSEDFNAGQVLAGAKVINPFAGLS